MGHVEFWTEYTRRLGAHSGWVVFENGTLVHPEGNDTAEEVLLRLDSALGGESGAGSPFGDFCVSDVGGGHFVCSFPRCCGLLLAHCEKSEIVNCGDIKVAAGLLARSRRNADARSRKRIKA